MNLESLYYSYNFSVALKFFKIKGLKEGHKTSFAGLEKAANMPEATPEQENWAPHPVASDLQSASPSALGSQHCALK